jgi:ABC-2 type transport system ATP-binding protein
MVFTYTRRMHNTNGTASLTGTGRDAAAKPPGGPPPVIEVAGLAKDYRVFDKPEGLLASVTGLFHRTSRLVEALRGVDLTVGRGEFVALLGPNGAGKTTFLKLLSGIITPSRGAARVLGYVPWERADDFRRRFALVMGQRNQLWWDLPAAESFRLHQEIYRIEPARFARIRDELVGMLGVQELILRPVRDLSLGERMKLELVAALLHEPEVLFLDEPTIGLDVVAQHTIHEFLRHVRTERRVTVILTTHYMKDVAALCERLVVITHGDILYDGSLAGVVDRFTTHKIVTLDFEEPPAPETLARFGFPCEVRGPQAVLRIDRGRIADVLPELLRSSGVRDVSVEDVPLEEIVAGMFRAAARPPAATAEAAR